MKRNCLFLICILLHYCTIGFCQGSWNIKYVPINNVDSFLIGKEVRIDFKKSSKDNFEGKFKTLNIRELLMINDSIKINFQDKLMNFREDWKIFADHGVLKDQSLILFPKKSILIKEMFLIGINKNYINVNCYIYEAGLSQKSIIYKKTEKILEFNISEVKGILIKK